MRFEGGKVYLGFVLTVKAGTVAEDDLSVQEYALVDRLGRLVGIVTSGCPMFLSLRGLETVWNAAAGARRQRIVVIIGRHMKLLLVRDVVAVWQPLQ